MPENQQQAPKPGGASHEADSEAGGGTADGPFNQPNISFALPDLLGGGGTDQVPYAEKAVLTVQRSSSWQGPYPSPDAIERFEATLPGAFNRILTMAEKAQDAQISGAAKAQLYLQMDVRRSHYLGAAISILAVVCSTVCALTGHPTASVALVGIPVMAVARAFVTTRRQGGGEADAEQSGEAE